MSKFEKNGGTRFLAIFDLHHTNHDLALVDIFNEIKKSFCGCLKVTMGPKGGHKKFRVAGHELNRNGTFDFFSIISKRAKISILPYADF